MIILVSGGRDYTDFSYVEQTLSRLFLDFPKACIIQGGARGADRLARDYCMKHGKPCLTMEASWDAYGSHAGGMRNQWMLDYGKPELVLCFPGGPGTRDMYNRATKQGFKAYNV